MSYQFKLDFFEGPLDLLLFLIKEQKMDIQDIPISAITDQYLSYLDLMQDLNLEVAGEYLLMAAELTRIKSRTLLPAKPEEEEIDPDTGVDPRAELMRRLMEYQRYKDAAFQLRQREFDQSQVFSRSGEVTVDEKEETLVDANVFDLLTAFQKMVQQKSFKKDYEIEVSILSVEDRIKYILEILNGADSVTFESLFTPINTRQEVIVLFLALLELMKLGLIRVQQVERLETIRVYKTVDKDEQEEILKNHQGSPSETPSE